MFFVPFQLLAFGIHENVKIYILSGICHRLNILDLFSLKKIY
jgi:hypothetical protein